MKDFRVRVRDIKEKNYHAVWSNLKTIRTGTGEAKELDPLYAEFYDIGLGNRCDTGRCPFCYVKANSDGRYYSDVLSSWRLWMKHYTKDKEENGIENIAFGANFYEYLQKGGLETWIYPPESFSKNMILGDGKVVITKSSFDLKPILTISL
jgi:hypothetical protein